MAEQQTIRRRATGLYTHPNVLEVPPGSLLVADNAVIDREWVIGKRRGFRRYGDMLDGPAAALFEFKKRLLTLDGDYLKYDSDGLGTWVAWAGNVLAPVLGIRIKPVETSGAIFIPTLFGILRNDALDGVPRLAGMPEAIDYEVSRIDSQLGGIGAFLPVDSAVAYRILWGRKDANGIIITGAPSHQERIVNAIVTYPASKTLGVVTVTVGAGHSFQVGDLIEISSPSDVLFDSGEKTITGVTATEITYNATDLVTGATGTVGFGKRYNVRLVITEPPGLQVGDFLEIYRTNVTVGASTDPGETYKRVRQINVGALVTALTFDDETPEALLDLPLYTNETQEGPGQKNDRPPHARFVAFYKTHTFYAYCHREQEVEIAMNDTDSIVVGVDTITIDAGTAYDYKFASAENQALREFRLWDTTDPETPTDAQVVERTMKSFQKIVNRDPDSQVLVYYTSGSDDAPGKVIIRRKEYQGDPFTVASTASNFTPDLTTTQTSVADPGENEVCRSKSDQPDHVPRLNRHKVGRKNKAILGLQANRDALFVLKEDGLFSINGESDGGPGFGFIVDEQDPTIICRAHNGLVGLDNAIYGMMNQGGVRMTQGGSSIFSRQVERDFNLLALSGRFREEAFGVAYESDRKYLLSLPDRTVWCYNYLTNAWTRWLLPVTDGHVLSDIDRLYYCHAEEPYILEERKGLSFDGADHEDEEFDVTCVIGFGTTTLNGRTVIQASVTHTYYQPIEVGWGFIQGTNQGVVEAVEDIGAGVTLLTLSIEEGAILVLGAATVTKPIPLRIIWTPETAGSAGTIKQFPGVQVYHEGNSAKHSTLGFLADTEHVFEIIRTFTTVSADGWGVLGWGTFPWGSPTLGRTTPQRPMTPQEHQRCRALTILYENVYAREAVNLIELALDVRPFGTRTSREPPA